MGTTERVSLKEDGEGRQLVVVRDNGCGIPPERLKKMFTHGFTTKKSGHGFALHSCVNLAREMGGDLSVASDGEGLGATKTSVTKTAGKKPERKMGALDAAAKVLGETGTPMNAKALIEAMSAKGYWTSPGGATPHATLYSAILREIQKKGPQARFARAENGFMLCGGSTTPAKKTAAKRTTKKRSKANDVPPAPAN